GGVPHEGLQVRLLARELFERGNHLLEFRWRDRTRRREGHPRHLTDPIPEDRESGHGGRPSIPGGGIDRNQESLGHELLAFGWLDRGLLAVLDHLEDRTGPIALHLGSDLRRELDLDATSRGVHGGFNVEDEPVPGRLDRKERIRDARPLEDLQDPAPAVRGPSESPPTTLDLDREGFERIRRLVHMAMELPFD